MLTSYHFNGKHDIKLKVVSGLFYVCSFVLSCKRKSKSSENGGQRSNTSFSPTVPWRLWHHRLSWIDHEQRWYVHINALQLCLCWRKYCSIILTQRLCFDVHVWPTCSLTLAASSLSPPGVCLYPSLSLCQRCHSLRLALRDWSLYQGE